MKTETVYVPGCLESLTMKAPSLALKQKIVCWNKCNENVALFLQRVFLKFEITSHVLGECHRVSHELQYELFIRGRNSGNANPRKKKNVLKYLYLPCIKY